MTCAQCGQREAIVFIRRSVGSAEGCDIMLCESCATRRGIVAGRGSLELNIDDLIGAGLEELHDRGATPSCPSCGLELSALKRELRLGCSVCAEAFAEEIEKSAGGRPDFGGSDSSFAGPTRLEPAPGAEGPPSRLMLELESALRSENYEEAATIRDELSRIGRFESPRPGPSYAPGFPFSDRLFSGDEGPHEDVVLYSSARVYRDLVGLPFPGSPRGPSAPSRSLLLERFRTYGSWDYRSMSELEPAQRRSLSERGIVPRGYAADDEAVVMTQSALGAYALFDETDHLRLRTLAPGLDVEAALSSALSIAERLGRDLDFARLPSIGWICSRLGDCGLGCSLSVAVHIPALSASGMRDRLFRALLADKLFVRGFYSSSEDSAGSVYEVGIESSKLESPAALAAAFSLSLSKLVAAERRARSEIASRGRGALKDAEGRAYGITRHFGLVGAEEAASLLSVLRLAALRGSLAGADPHRLGGLLMALGPASVALAAGMRDIPASSSLDSLRAGIVKDALASAEYRTEEIT